MTYFKSKLRAIFREYRGKDRIKLIRAAHKKCPMCGKMVGEYFLFGPTRYLKRRLRFKVRLDVHVVDGAPIGNKNIVLCNGCHVSYHLMNRLSEDAELGGKRLGSTVYKRCRKCKELNCMCCPKCHDHPRKCTCNKKQEKQKYNCEVTKKGDMKNYIRKWIKKYLEKYVEESAKKYSKKYAKKYAKKYSRKKVYKIKRRFFSGQVPNRGSATRRGGFKSRLGYRSANGGRLGRKAGGRKQYPKVARERTRS